MVATVSESFHRLIVRMYQGYDSGSDGAGEGLPVDVIAAELGLDEPSVVAVLITEGLYTPPPPNEGLRTRSKGLSKPIVDGIIADYNAGVLVTDMAKRWRVSPDYIYDVLSDNEVPPRRYVPRKTTSVRKARQAQELIEMYAPLQPDGSRDPHKGATYREIATAFGVSKACVYNLIKKYGVPMRFPPRTKRVDRGGASIFRTLAEIAAELGRPPFGQPWTESIEEKTPSKKPKV